MVLASVIDSNVPASFRIRFESGKGVASFDLYLLRIGSLQVRKMLLVFLKQIIKAMLLYIPVVFSLTSVATLNSVTFSRESSICCLKLCPQ